MENSWESNISKKKQQKNNVDNILPVPSKVWIKTAEEFEIDRKSQVLIWLTSCLGSPYSYKLFHFNFAG